MFDPEIFEIGGVVLLVLCFGLVQFLKELFNLEGKPVTALSAVLGVVLMVAFQLIDLLPPAYEQVVRIAVISLAFGLAASGYYKFINARAPTFDSDER
jgi:hypothetical protein